MPTTPDSTTPPATTLKMATGSTTPTDTPRILAGVAATFLAGMLWALATILLGYEGEPDAEQPDTWTTTVADPPTADAQPLAG